MDKKQGNNRNPGRTISATNNIIISLFSGLEYWSDLDGQYTILHAIRYAQTVTVSPNHALVALETVMRRYEIEPNVLLLWDSASLSWVN